MEVLLYVPSLAFFFLTAIVSALIFYWSLSKQGMPYEYNIAASFGVMAMTAVALEMPVGIPFIAFALGIAAVSSYSVAFLVPFISALGVEETEDDFSIESLRSNAGEEAPRAVEGLLNPDRVF